jgi:flagellar biogenesis protein FliO
MKYIIAVFLAIILTNWLLKKLMKEFGKKVTLSTENLSTIANDYFTQNDSFLTIISNSDNKTVIANLIEQTKAKNSVQRNTKYLRARKFH